MPQNPLFIQIGKDKFIAVEHILFFIQRENGNIDIDYGRHDETLLLVDEEASQFMKLFAEHCQVVGSASEGKHE